LRVLEDAEVKMLVLDLFKISSDRDKQRKIGPSQIGDPCDYCVGAKLLGRKQLKSRYWLAGKLGTAMHSMLEAAVAEADKTDYRFTSLLSAKVEQKVMVYNLSGYGTISGKIDLQIPGVIIDYKSTTKLKLAKYKLDGVPHQYVVQQNLYAFGVNQLGGEQIQKICLVFVNRDGQGDGDVTIISFKYDEKVALEALVRLESIWQWVKTAPENLNDLASDPGCFYCNQVEPRH